MNGREVELQLPYEERIINNVRNRISGLVNSVTEAGGWPEVEHNTRILIVPENPHDDDDGDGYTNLVVYDIAECAEVWQIKRNLQEDDFIYGDRQYTFSYMIEIVAGCTWISPMKILVI